MEAGSNNNFKKAFEVVINGFEGKYSNDKDDPGGETYKGIARNMNKDFEGWGIIDGLRGNNNFPGLLESNNTLQEHVMDFYKKNYWDKFWGDGLKEITGIEMFDQSVNLGTGRAIEHLQRSLNILNNQQQIYPNISVDGVMGNKSFGAYIKCCSDKKRDTPCGYTELVSGKILSRINGEEGSI